MSFTRSIRFSPDRLDSALVQFSDQADFKPDEVALILNESFTGSGLLLVTDHKIKADDKLKVKVGRLGEMLARVIWVKEIDKGILKLGVEYQA